MKTTSILVGGKIRLDLAFAFADPVNLSARLLGALIDLHKLSPHASFDEIYGTIRPVVEGYYAASGRNSEVERIHHNLKVLGIVSNNAFAERAGEIMINACYMATLEELDELDGIEGADLVNLLNSSSEDFLLMIGTQHKHKDLLETLRYHKLDIDRLRELAILYIIRSTLASEGYRGLRRLISEEPLQYLYRYESHRITDEHTIRQVRDVSELILGGYQMRTYLWKWFLRLELSNQLIFLRSIITQTQKPFLARETLRGLVYKSEKWLSFLWRDVLGIILFRRPMRVIAMPPSRYLSTVLRDLELRLARGEVITLEDITNRTFVFQETSEEEVRS